MSFVLLGILNAQASGVTPGPYFIGTYGDSNIAQPGRIAIDSNNYIYAGGRSYPGSGGYQAYVFSWDNLGTPRWLKRFGSGNNEINSLVCDSADNVIAAGYTGTSASGATTGFLVKFNSSGTAQWARDLDSSGEDEAEGVGVDSSDNVYFSEWSGYGIGRKDVSAKRNSAGVIQWQRRFGDSGSNQQPYGGRADASGNWYSCGYTNHSTQQGYVIKYNTSGTIQWQKSLTGASNENIYNVAIDSSGNVYAVGNTSSEGSGSNDALIAKYNSSGSLQWQKIIGGTGNDFFRDVAIDSNGDIFAVGNENGINGLITKWDSSGNLIFQRTFNRAIPYGVVVNSDDDIYMHGYTDAAGAGSGESFLWYLPGDGSREGTYTLDGFDFTYAASSLTASTSTLTDTTLSQSIVTSGNSDESLGFSYAVPSWTQYLELV